MPLPYSFLMTDDQHLWSASGQTSKFNEATISTDACRRMGERSESFRRFLACTSSMSTARAPYTADVHVGRLMKLRPKANLPASERAFDHGADARAVRTVTTSSSN